MKLVLGIDTSNYTTSICLVGEDGKVVADQRKILNVASGARGLRQSEALFQHVKNLPELTANIQNHFNTNTLTAIGVSAKPRPRDDSYMPVFIPGTSFASSLGHILGIPVYETTHQETHIWSGVASSGGLKESRFLALHLSGGTTELTEVKRYSNDFRLAVESLGCTLDLHAGQLVDRLGVKLGLPFPAGPLLENLANKTLETVPISTFHRNGKISFSGPLTALERIVGQVEPEILARTCLDVIARTLIKWIRFTESKTDCREILVIGGVAANLLIREQLEKSLPDWKLFFASPKYSVDNAYGAAYYGALRAGIITIS
ncbi:MAG: O-sialoglycoprotein endopeptidase [Bacillota bacterium]|nr:O-sialoglycoprotein endopeptidase [Bacillota bacterium]HHU60410.1 O-sialoglycoprotein endopeptidase [Natronincola sp.]